MNRFILPHEHMSIDLSKEKNNDDCRLNVLSDGYNELVTLKKQGIKAIFDCSNRGMGRDFETYKKIQEEFDIPIFCGTGYYKDPFMPEEVEKLDVLSMANLMIKELTSEVECGFKASYIGEIGTSHNKITLNERKLFEAAVIAHHQTQAPILTHTTLGSLGIEQVRFFKEKQVDPKKIIISHVDLKDDFDSIVELLNEGVYVGFDTIGKLNYLSDEKRVQWIVKLVELGYEKQLILSLDITRKSHLKENGGIGYGYFMENFIEKLKSSGMSEKTLDNLCYQNPLDWLGVAI